MTRSATGRFLASFCLSVLLGAAASADPGDDRLFVLVSPPHVAGPSAIAAFAIRTDGRLETVTGSPFAVGEPPLTYSPVFLTTAPEASFL